MPELSRFYGIIVKMIYDDNDKHHKPHVHVYYGDYEASVGLDGEVLDGSLPLKQYRLLSGWMAYMKMNSIRRGIWQCAV